MIESILDWVISLLLPVSIVLSVMLLSHSMVMKYLGATSSYAFWIMLPLTILFYSIPLPWESFSIVSNAPVSQYLVTSQSHIQQAVTTNWLLTVWGMGIVMFITYWVLTHINFLKSLILEPASLNIAQMSSNKALPSSLPIFRSTHAFSPMLIGVLKQKLIIPEDFEAIYSAEQQSLILEHEICHYERRDIYWNLIAMACLALFWFHPLAWQAYFRYRRDQELSCDQLVLARKQTKCRINYSKALLVAAETAPPMAFAQLSFKKYGAKDIMFERINQIKLNTKASGVSLSVISLVSLTLLSGVSYAGSHADQTLTHKQQASEKVDHISPVIRIEPRYPIKAVEERREGSVLLKYDITPKGTVNNVSVVKSIPDDIFNKEAKTALKQWEYKPSDNGFKNNLVQLDFALTKEGADSLQVLTERIKVTN